MAGCSVVVRRAGHAAGILAGRTGPTGELRTKLPCRVEQIAFEHPSYRTARLDCVFVDEEAGPIRVRMWPRTRRRIRVLGANGAELETARFRTPFADVPAERLALEDGRTAYVLSADVGERVRVEAPGHGARVVVVPDLSVDPVVVRLDPECLLTGVASVELEVLHVAESGTYGPRSLFPGQEVSVGIGADGRFEVRGLRPGFAGTLTARKHGAPVRRLAFQMPAGSAAHDLGRVFLGEVDDLVRGRVVDPEGQPVPFALLRGRRGSSARADAGGRFAFSLSYLGTRVFAEAAGRVRSEPVTCAAGEDLTIVLPRGHALEGRVIDGTGRPMVGATIRVHSSESAASAFATAGADGRFRIEGLPPEDLFVEASSPGYLHDGPSVAVRTGAEVVLRMIAAGCLEAALCGPGSPVPHPPRTLRAESGDTAITAHVPPETDRARIALPPGTWSVVASIGPEEPREHTVTIQAGRTAKLFVGLGK